MRKDIEIPEVKDVYVAAILEFNEVHRTNDWNVYLINAKNSPLETVLIVSKGFDAERITSQMRHKLDVLPAKSFAKIEFLEDSVLKLNNEFSVTFFVGNNLFEKKFLYKPNTITKENNKALPIMLKEGILAL
ncbi:MAG: hypothetical protein V7767_08005 [Leeuwenhoekiella sp.]